MEVKSLGSAKYSLVLKVDSSRMSFVFVFKTKDEVSKYYKESMDMAKNRTESDKFCALEVKKYAQEIWNYSPNYK